jgi:prepilin-type N-terminal cleavage/methylation domain-containing protein/prepilin-type processing-associated H-X9-DG protein
MKAPSTNEFVDIESRPRKAFTLVELLVVIAIIGILVAMTLPAVQATREAARRTSCINTLTQLGLAAHSYEFHFETLPSGVTNPVGPIRSEPQGKHVSWIVRILPYMEENTLFRNFDAEAGAYAPVNAAVRITPISILECPSEPNPFLNDSGNVALSSYVGCHNDVEAPIDKDNHGLLFLNSKVRYIDIEDGSSKTILLGEARVMPESLGWVSGTRATLRNTSAIEQRPLSPSGTVEGPQDENKKATASLVVGGFSSNHPGGINAGFADGSTRFIAENIDTELLHQLGNRADGQIMMPF